MDQSGSFTATVSPLPSGFGSPTEYSATTILVYSQDNIDIRFIVKKEGDHAVVTAKTTNNSLNMLEKFMLQVR